MPSSQPVASDPSIRSLQIVMADIVLASNPSIRSLQIVMADIVLASDPSIRSLQIVMADIVLASDPWINGSNPFRCCVIIGPSRSAPHSTHTHTHAPMRACTHAHTHAHTRTHVLEQQSRQASPVMSEASRSNSPHVLVRSMDGKHIWMVKTY